MARRKKKTSRGPQQKQSQSQQVIVNVHPEKKSKKKKGKRAGGAGVGPAIIQPVYQTVLHQPASVIHVNPGFGGGPNYPSASSGPSSFDLHHRNFIPTSISEINQEAQSLNFHNELSREQAMQEAYDLYNNHFPTPAQSDISMASTSSHRATDIHMPDAHSGVTSSVYTSASASSSSLPPPPPPAPHHHSAHSHNQTVSDRLSRFSHHRSASTSIKSERSNQEMVAYNNPHFERGEGSRAAAAANNSPSGRSTYKIEDVTDELYQLEERYKNGKRLKMSREYLNHTNAGLLVLGRQIATSTGDQRLTLYMGTNRRHHTTTMINEIESALSRSTGQSSNSSSSKNKKRKQN